MMEKIKKLMMKKAKAGKGIMSPKEKDAASSVLDDLDSLADEGIAGGMKKVTVASDSEEGLEEGLEKAKEVVEEMPEGMMAESDDDEDELEEMSEEEIDEMIAMLMEKKRSKSDDSEEEMA